MTSKLPFFENSQENSQIMFQFMLLTKLFKKRNQHSIPDFFFNAMIRNIKIQNILNIIEIFKSMEPNKFTQFLKFMIIFI
jgi:hypothetical protein